ncbi:MAG: hypothetical protein IPL46_34170 [Saprospiraceae bacterium]|nr:hypothetical protein [Saprospiraceae bacterium]
MMTGKFTKGTTWPTALIITLSWRLPTGDILAQDTAYLLVDMVRITSTNNGSGLVKVKCMEVLEIPDTIKTVEDLTCKIFVPNAYLPSFGGINDKFFPGLHGNIIDFIF